MRKLKTTAILGTMLVASIVPSVVHGAARAKARKAEHHSTSAAARGTASRSTGRGSATGVSSSATTKTRKKSRSKGKSRRDTSWRRGQKGPTPDRINEIQEALARQGAYSGAPTGKWDAKTVEGMRRFQSAHSLNPTGKLDALTLQKLGLGSDVAGIAPPQPLLPDGPLALRRQR